MIEFDKEKVVTFAQAARMLPCRRQGKPTSTSTIWRWANRGIKGVKLETLRVGGSTCTSAEALQRFFEATSSPAAVPGARTKSEATRAHILAERELERMGI